MNRQPIYLDYAAATPVAPEVSQHMQNLSREIFANPSSSHVFGRKARQIIDDARAHIATILHCEVSEIYFTHSATEANNLALRGIAYAARRQYHRNHIVVSAVEHSSILQTAKALEHEDFRVTYLPVDRYGVVQEDALVSAISHDTNLVSIMIANNEVGTIQPIQSYVALVRTCAPYVAFHTDAVQWPGFGTLNTQSLGIDAMTLSGAKIYGPPDCSMLFVRNGIACDPLLFGGRQEHGLWPGTEHAVSIAGFAYALELAEARRSAADSFHARRNIFLETLRSHVSDCVVNGHQDNILPHIVHLTFPGVDQDALLVALDQVGLAVSGGAACDAGAQRISHVIEALHLPKLFKQAHMRLSFGISTSEKELREAAERIVQVVSQLRST